MIVARPIARAVGRSGFNHYICLNYRASEGNWRWVTGHRASTDDVTPWSPGESNGGERQDCAIVLFYDNSVISGLLVFDQECSFERYPICEKLI